MAALAGLLTESGYRVTGSDQAVYPPMSDLLAELGINIMEGYKASNLDARPDLVIVGNVIRRVNPEAIALEESGIPFCSMPAAIRILLWTTIKPGLLLRGLTERPLSAA